MSHILVTSQQNFMKLKMNFKQTRATSAGDINSPNLLVYIVIRPYVTRLVNFSVVSARGVLCVREVGGGRELVGLVGLYNGAFGSAQPSFHVPCSKWSFRMTWLRMLFNSKI